MNSTETMQMAQSVSMSFAIESHVSDTIESQIKGELSEKEAFAEIKSFYLKQCQRKKEFADKNIKPQLKRDRATQQGKG
jgi:hypothetical protein